MRSGWWFLNMQWRTTYTDSHWALYSFSNKSPEWGRRTFIALNSLKTQRIQLPNLDQPLLITCKLQESQDKLRAQPWYGTCLRLDVKPSLHTGWGWTSQVNRCKGFTLGKSKTFSSYLLLENGETLLAEAFPQGWEKGCTSLGNQPHQQLQPCKAATSLKQSPQRHADSFTDRWYYLL